MKEININISDRLYYKLNEIKSNIEKNENKIISFSELIEEAIIEYFNISLIDINNVLLKNNESNINPKFNYCVYAYIDLSKEVNLDIGIDRFDYEPIYIGMGSSSRINSMTYRDNKLIKKINFLKKNNEFGVTYLKRGLSKTQANKLESDYIKLIGRLDDGSGSLYNKNNGNKRLIESGTSELDLEKSFAIHIVNVLNEKRTIREAANALNLSERTVYRKMETYNIIRDKNKKGNHFYFKNK